MLCCYERSSAVDSAVLRGGYQRFERLVRYPIYSLHLSSIASGTRVIVHDGVWGLFNLQVGG